MDGGILTRSLVNANEEVSHGRDKNQKTASTGSTMRRKGLTDITNMSNTVGLEVNENGCTSQNDGIKTNPKLMPSPKPKDCMTQLVKLDSPSLTHQVSSEEKEDGRRQSLRRRSISTLESNRPVEDMVKMKVNEVPVHSVTESLHEGVSIEMGSSNSSSSNNEIIQVEEQNLIGSKQLKNRGNLQIKGHCCDGQLRWSLLTRKCH